LRSMRGATGTITVREQADKSAATMMPAPTYAFMTASLFLSAARATLHEAAGPVSQNFR
jgi:hypothetical protein